MILDESIIEAQKEFITKEFGIQLINSEERDDRLAFQYNGKSTDGYRYLAMMNWPEMFEANPNLEVHHISGDRSDNRLCNLVPLTRKQHRNIHTIFFEDYRNVLKELAYNMSKNNLGRTHEYRPCKEETKAKLSAYFSGRHRYRDENGKWHWEI